MLAEILSHLRALAREREVPTELIKRPKERGRISFVVDEVTSPCGRQLGAGSRNLLHYQIRSYSSTDPRSDRP